MPQLKWSSSDETVFTANPKTGSVTASKTLRGVHTAYLKTEVVGNPKITDSVPVHVVWRPDLEPHQISNGAVGAIVLVVCLVAVNLGWLGYLYYNRKQATNK